jgi:NAD(P)-dependent dehydrogenase (short-subunit alcohol dehydrogenase family)
MRTTLRARAVSAEYYELSRCVNNRRPALAYGFTLSLKNEIVKIAPSGRVNCVSPGWVRTAMAEEALKDPLIVYRALAT